MKWNVLLLLLFISSCGVKGPVKPPLPNNPKPPAAPDSQPANSTSPSSSTEKTAPQTSDQKKKTHKDEEHE